MNWKISVLRAEFLSWITVYNMQIRNWSNFCKTSVIINYHILSTNWMLKCDVYNTKTRMLIHFMYVGFSLMMLAVQVSTRYFF